MKTIKKIEYSVLQPDQLLAEQNILVEKAKDAITHAYAPYSNFKVGAAVLMESGAIVTGSNQENVAYPSGLCAERVAIFAAHHQYPTEKIKEIVIAAADKNGLTENPITPCAACVQVMSESVRRNGETFPVIMVGKNSSILVPDALDLVPFRFDG